VSQPDLDGTQAFYDSGGLINDGDTFTVKLSPSIKPGTYSYMCLIHRGAMTAKVTVAPPAQSIPSASDQKAKGDQEFNQLQSQLKPVADAAKQPNGTTVKGGAGDPKLFNAIVTEFGPKDVSVPVGGSVTWDMFFFHTVSFGTSAADVGIFTKAADGTLQFSPKALAPAGVNVPAAAGEFPPPDNASPLAISFGPYDGSGFESTGILGSVPPQLISVKASFPKAGTYTYRCLFHRDMEGTVKVG